MELQIDNFSIEQIAASGQCFRMTGEEDGSYSVIAGDRYIRVRQNGLTTVFDCTDEDFGAFWCRYFDLDNDYGRYIDAIDPGDDYLKEAGRLGSGIRILRQDLWEMIVTFLISQMNNITRIRRCIANISEKYGEKKQTPGGAVYYAFPRPEALCCLPEDSLMECNLGYRSKYVVRCAKDAAEGRLDLNAVSKMDYASAREELLTLFGVGKKVADCICLFSLHHLEAFPVDTHIEQVLAREYAGNFPFERYAGFEGVIQQYIFYNELHH